MKRSKAEVTLDKVLGDIEQGKRYQADNLRKLHEARRGFVPPSRMANATSEELARAHEQETYIAALEAEAERFERELAKAWDFAAALADPVGRLPGTDEDLASGIAALESRRSALVASSPRYREDAHREADAHLDEHAARFEALLAASRLGEWEFEELARLWPFVDNAFRARVHDGIDALPASEFAAGSRSSFEAELAMLGRQIQRRRAELEAREAERAVAEAEAAKARALAVAASVSDD